MTAIGRIFDISSQQHPGGAPIDFVKVKAAGGTTVLIKATEGTSYVNPYYADDVKMAQAAELDVLAYHFASFTDPMAEALAFMRVAGKLARIGDFETSTNAAWMREFLAFLPATRNHLVGYGSESTFKDVYQHIPALPWVAAYPVPLKPPPAGYPGWGVMWQFTDSAVVPGIRVPVDESSWHGSVIQYETLFGTFDPPPDPTPPTEDDMPLYVVTHSTGAAYTTDMLTKVPIPSEQDLKALTQGPLHIEYLGKGILSDQFIDDIPLA